MKTGNVNAAIVADTNTRLFVLQQQALKQNNLQFFQELRGLVERHEKKLPESDLHLEKMATSSQKRLLEKHGYPILRVEYDLEWSDFVIDNNENGAAHLSFEIRASFLVETSIYNIRNYILAPGCRHAFRDHFLLKEVRSWLHEQGYDFRGTGFDHSSSFPGSKRNVLTPYIKVSVNEKWVGHDQTFLQVTGKCSAEIIKQKQQS